QPVQDLTIDAETGPTQYRFALEGADPDVVNEWTDKLVAKLGTVPQVHNVTSDAATQGLAATIDIDRDSAARLSITAATVDEALYSACGPRILATIFNGTHAYRRV